MQREGGSTLRRPIIRTAAMLATLITISAACAGDDGVGAVKTPEVRAVPTIAEPETMSKPKAPKVSGGGTEIVDIPEIRIGTFKRPNPELVPYYEVLEREPVDGDEARAVRLLVDTRARSEAGYEIIARDLKARYADYDAISAEFTDTSEVLDYNGGALIFNTPAGARYIGYIYGPPNTKGYYVRAAD